MRMTYFYMAKKAVKEQVECFRYIRDDGKQPIGIAVLDKQGRIGWSLYNESHEDEMASTDKGLLIALNRAKSGLDAELDIENRIKATVAFGRATRLVQAARCVALVRGEA